MFLKCKAFILFFDINAVLCSPSLQINMHFNTPLYAVSKIQLRATRYILQRYLYMFLTFQVQKMMIFNNNFFKTKNVLCCSGNGFGRLKHLKLSTFRRKIYAGKQCVIKSDTGLKKHYLVQKLYFISSL